jgi:hypothetical protein
MRPGPDATIKGDERVDTLVGRVPKAVIADRLRALRD